MSTSLPKKLWLSWLMFAGWRWSYMDDVWEGLFLLYLMIFYGNLKLVSDDCSELFTVFNLQYMNSSFGYHPISFSLQRFKHIPETLSKNTVLIYMIRYISQWYFLKNLICIFLIYFHKRWPSIIGRVHPHMSSTLSQWERTHLRDATRSCWANVSSFWQK